MIEIKTRKENANRANVNLILFIQNIRGFIENKNWINDNDRRKKNHSLIG